MKRKLLTLLICATSGVAIFVWCAVIRGATEAVFDQLSGRRILYEMGCSIGPARPYEPVPFRHCEIVEEQFSLHFEITGGFAPSREIEDFVKGYNTVSYALLRWRFGKDFLERTKVEAERDVVRSKTTLSGCLADHLLELNTGERIVLWSSELVSDQSLELEKPTSVTVTGELTQVRKGKWNIERGQRMVVESVESNTEYRCPAATR